MQLPMPDIDGVDARGAASKQDLRESSRRSADVQTDASLRRKREVIQRRGQLHPTAGDIGMRRLILNGHAFTQFLGRFGDLLPIGLHPSCLNRRLRLGPARSETVADKEYVRALTSIRH